jgi:hypothetical protein
MNADFNSIYSHNDVAGLKKSGKKNSSLLLWDVEEEGGVPQKAWEWIRSSKPATDS